MQDHFSDSSRRALKIWSKWSKSSWLSPSFRKALTILSVRNGSFESRAYARAQINIVVYESHSSRKVFLLVYMSGCECVSVGVSL